MRNIAEYPIESDEVISAAEEALEVMSEKYNLHIGSTIAYSLQLLCDFIREEEPALIAFLERRASELKP